ncbi:MULTISPECIES: DUF1150 family protein [Oceanibaculum]|uniref:DUF1150 family protein n=2 Tax=Oceanibaculum indicum TaxID=526216 RepID=K2JQR1_9PROT|nr:MULTISPECIES: DUF1150 family protein [Oceanibaculum]EKE76872.1 hypothetical protein P24_06706 [Oceanibaculum indicum P24]MCH2393985.1 DUF1150 domain-containing protein [Oceanibaculum sp.]RKQ68355.1 hypothetical protein BCL74_2834 [Oceanibaculum indicum]
MNMLQKFHPMSHQDLVMLGLNDVAYIRRVSSKEGPASFAIHAADGTEMLVVDNVALAMATIRQNDMEPLLVH